MIAKGKYKSQTDEELFVSMKSGDRFAFDTIYQRYWGKLYAESFKRLKNPQQIEELVQDIFSDLWLKRESKEIKNLRNYLLMCTRYQVFGIYRKEQGNPSFEEPLENMASYNIYADSALNEKELKGCVALWLASQPKKRGEIFRLKYMEERGTREISEMLNLSQKTVQNQVLSSIISLRQYLRKSDLLSTISFFFG